MRTTAPRSPLVGGVEHKQALRALATIHSKRYLRHPVFLVTMLLLAGGVVQNVVGSGSDSWEGILTYPLWIGLPGVVIGYRLAVTENKALSLLPSAPVDLRVRTLALYAACAVPVAATGVFMLLNGATTALVGDPTDAFVLRPSTGEIGWVAYVASVGEVLVASFGGAALGVTVGRWLRFPGAGILVAVVLFLIEVVALGAGEGAPTWQDLWARGLNNLMPYGYWKASPEEARVYTTMRPGSPVGHLVYSMALCGLAITAGVLKGAEPAVRTAWRRIGWISLAVAFVAYLWALLG